MSIFSFNVLLLQARLQDKSIIERYIEIFTDPIFLMMLATAAGIVYVFYRIYVVKDAPTQLSEEEERLQTHLNYYGFQMLGAEKQKDRGPFKPEAKEEKEESLLSQRNKKQKLEKLYTFWKIKAQDKEGEANDFWAKIEYTSAKITAVYWLPALEKEVAQK